MKGGAMLSKVTRNILKGEHSYPRLMETRDGAVVLFTEPCKGTVVHVGTDPDGSIPSRTLGHRSSAWLMSAFKQFSGTVSLGDEE